MAVMAKIKDMTWIPVVERGFCCCTLETFCKVLGYMTAISSLLVMGFEIFNWFTFALCDGYWAGGYPAEPRSSFRISCRGERSMSRIATSVILFILQGVVAFVTSVTFLVGIHLRRPRLLTQFVVYLQLQLILAIHCSIAWTVQAPLLSLLWIVPAIGLALYTLACANSLRLTLVKEERSKCASDAEAAILRDGAVLGSTPHPELANWKLGVEPCGVKSKDYINNLSRE